MVWILVDKRILEFDTQEATLEIVGGKGKSLSEMIRAGLPVPAGFHITTNNYKDFVSLHAIDQYILQEATKTDSKIEASEKIKKLFRANELPVPMKNEIREAYSALGENPAVAVRSSANAEDLPEMS